VRNDRSLRPGLCPWLGFGGIIPRTNTEGCSVVNDRRVRIADLTATFRGDNYGGAADMGGSMRTNGL
jgi:hypothetical protein